MAERMTTPDRILRAARQLFNEKGYAATTQAEIAQRVGIAQGNLTYHFPTKRDLISRMDKLVHNTMQSRWSTPRVGPVAEDYVEHLLFAMNLTWEYRFLLRDQAQFADDSNWLNKNVYMQADLKELQSLIERIDQQALFLPERHIDLDVLARSLWIISRYWMDHLSELEGTDAVTWEDLERGIQHHLDLLNPFLLPSARQQFATAMANAMRFLRKFEPGEALSNSGLR